MLFRSIFPRFPNFDFMDLEPTEENIYGKFNGTKRNIDEYSRLEYEKQSTLSKLGFAKNVYGDDMAQIVYNDDINISNIKDNLGRPLTSLYLSFFKTNYGRKEWYDGYVKNKNVEHSHCFGKLNSSKAFSDFKRNSNIHSGSFFKEEISLTISSFKPIFVFLTDTSSFLKPYL